MEKPTGDAFQGRGVLGGFRVCGVFFSDFFTNLLFGVERRWKRLLVLLTYGSSSRLKLKAQTLSLRRYAAA